MFLSGYCLSLKVAYVDSEHTFRGERIRSIAERFGLDPDAVLDNIVYARAFNHEHQVRCCSHFMHIAFKLDVITVLTMASFCDGWWEIFIELSCVGASVCLTKCIVW